MTVSLTTDLLDRCFQAVAQRLTTPLDLYLLGGAALYLLGSPRLTYDIDYVGDDLPPPDDPIPPLLCEVAATLNIVIEAVPIEGFIPLPPNSAARHLLVNTYGLLTVYVFDPYTLALSKLERGFDDDLNDVVFLLRQNLIEIAQLETFATDMAQQAGSYLIDPRALQNNLIALRKLLNAP